MSRRFIFLFLIHCLLVLPVQAIELFEVEHSGVTYDVVRLNKGGEQQLQFFWKRADGTAYQTIHALRMDVEGQGRRLVFATNGGIYSKQFTPLGLYIENGKRYYKLNKGKGGGNFFLKPNGVFYITAKGAVVTDTRFYNPKRKVINAVQSGPLLVSKNKLHPRFLKNSPSVYMRNGVGVDKAGKVIFAISNSPVNLYDFATLFRDKLDAPNALYLDGSISQMYAPDLNRYGGWVWNQFTTMIGLVDSSPPVPAQQ